MWPQQLPPPPTSYEGNREEKSHSVVRNSSSRPRKESLRGARASVSSPCGARTQPLGPVGTFGLSKQALGVCRISHWTQNSLGPGASSHSSGTLESGTSLIEHQTRQSITGCGKHIKVSRKQNRRRPGNVLSNRKRGSKGLVRSVLGPI